ncbi:MAG: hypothetical protein ACK4OM_03680 [Alphaproteobacteria bacterium]
MYKYKLIPLLQAAYTSIEFSEAIYKGLHLNSKGLILSATLSAIPNLLASSYASDEYYNEFKSWYEAGDFRFVMLTYTANQLVADNSGIIEYAIAGVSSLAAMWSLYYANETVRNYMYPTTVEILDPDYVDINIIGVDSESTM